jgi:hypothetical protein
VLSRCGTVMPQVQWEQHQPVKSSPSTQIKRLLIHLPLRLWNFGRGRGGGIQQRVERRKVNSCPPESIVHGFEI